MQPTDKLGRCGPAYAMVGPETMPDDKRGSIGMVRPSGWRVSKYTWVDGGYLYNRCHLIAFQLTGDNEADGAVSADDSAIWKSGSKPIEPVVADSADAAAPPDATATTPATRPSTPATAPAARATRSWPAVSAPVGA